MVIEKSTDNRPPIGGTSPGGISSRINREFTPSRGVHPFPGFESGSLPALPVLWDVVPKDDKLAPASWFGRSVRPISDLVLYALTVILSPFLL